MLLVTQKYHNNSNCISGNIFMLCKIHEMLSYVTSYMFFFNCNPLYYSMYHWVQLPFFSVLIM